MRSQNTRASLIVVPTTLERNWRAVYSTSGNSGIVPSSSGAGLYPLVHRICYYPAVFLNVSEDVFLGGFFIVYWQTISFSCVDVNEVDEVTGSDIDYEHCPLFLYCGIISHGCGSSSGLFRAAWGAWLRCRFVYWRLQLFMVFVGFCCQF